MTHFHLLLLRLFVMIYIKSLWTWLEICSHHEWKYVCAWAAESFLTVAIKAHINKHIWEIMNAVTVLQQAN